jgi:hypothetical protein
MIKRLTSGTRGAWPVFLWAAAFGAVETAGCGLFDIRDPIEPRNPVGCRRVSPVNAESVLVNFESALGCKGAGIGQYEDALSDEFQLVLDEVDSLDLGFSFLTKEQSRQALSLLTESIADSFRFEFDLVTPVEGPDTTSYLDMPYRLDFLRRQGDTLAVVGTVAGTTDLSLAEQLAGTWAITRWVDQRSEGVTSFGRWQGERVITGAPGPGVIN